MDALLIVTILIFVVWLSIVRRMIHLVTIHGNSMLPTYSDGDRVLIMRRYPRRYLRHGQVVVLKQLKTEVLSRALDEELIHHPFGAGGLYIKRITALPGETITVELKDLEVELRPLLAHNYDDSGKRIWHIPSNSYFVRGDNGGLDSRIYGYISREQILGVVIYKFTS